MRYVSSAFFSPHICQPVTLYSISSVCSAYYSYSFLLIANPIGIGVIYVIAPRIVNDNPTHQIPLLVMINYHLTIVFTLFLISF